MTSSEKILQKALVASNLDSKEWNGIQAALRDRAFFSSQVANVKILHAARSMVAEQAAGGKSLSEIRRDLRTVISSTGYDPGDARGTIKDLYTKARLDVIVKTNVAQARGYIQHLEATTPGGYAAFPAQELIRTKTRKQPRNWAKRWEDAGGKFFEGRMIALKDDPVWTKISAFGNPFPPFDFGSGMGVRGIKRSEAIRLGLISGDELKEKVKSLEDKRDTAGAFNANLQSEVPMEDDSKEAKALKEIFGDQIKFDGNAAHWQSELIQDVLKGTIKKAKLGIGFDGKNLSISHTVFKEHLAKHVGDAETHGKNIPLTPGDYDLLPTIWRNPESISYSKDNTHLTFTTFDGGILHLFIHPNKGIVSFYKTKSPKGAW